MEAIASLPPAFPQRMRMETLDGCVGYCLVAEDNTQAGLCQYSGKEFFDPDQLRRIRFDGDSLWLELVSAG